MNTLQERLLELFPEPHKRGLKAEIARLCHVKPPSVTAWFSDPLKVTTLHRTHAERICATYHQDISPIWLAEGVGPKMRPELPLLSQDALNVDGGARHRKGSSLRDSIRSLMSDGLEPGQVRVPVLQVTGSMGSGEETPADEAISGSITLAIEWVTNHLRATKADHLRFIHGHGDSMSPTFESGDVLLVDSGVKEVQIDGIYVLSAHGRLFIKRVRQRMDGSFEVSSDNPAHKTVDVLNGQEDVSIHGRVVWAWNGKKI